MIPVLRGSCLAFLHHLRASRAPVWVAAECRGAAGQQLDFIERSHRTGPRFQEIPSVGHKAFFFLSSTEAELPELLQPLTRRKPHLGCA